MSANARNHQLILLNYLSGSDVIFEHELVLDQSIAVDCAPKSIELIHPWSERLLLILCFGNHNSFVI